MEWLGYFEITWTGIKNKNTAGCALSPLEEKQELHTVGGGTDYLKK